MKNIVNTYVERFTTERLNSIKKTFIFIFLAILVTVGIFWRLHVPGIALTGDINCEITEHQHNEECYEGVLVCELEESETHTHSQDCYETQLICGLEEHMHSAECMGMDYDNERNSEIEISNDIEIETEMLLEDASRAEFVYQVISAESNGAVITVNGMLPENSSVAVTPVEVEIEGKEVIMAFDISIYDADRRLYEPEDGTISVTIESSALTGDNDVYYIPDDGDPEKLENGSEEGTVSFEAEHFSVYAVTNADAVVASGTIANGEGVTDAITWTIYEDDAGERTLVISGTGAIPDYISGTLTPWYSYCNTSSTTLKLVIEENITAVGKYAFHQSYISEVSFPDTLTSIGDYAFFYSRVLASVVIPDNVTYIGTSAFQYSQIVEITLGNNVETIGSFAFYSNASGSTVIYIPDSVTSIGADAFNLASAYEISGSNTTYKVIDGVLHSYDGTTLIDFPKQKVLDTYTVPESVKTIAVGALRYVKYVNNLIIGHAVTFTNSGYSMSNSNYQYIYLADGIVITGNSAFYDNPNLSELRLPEGTTFTFNVGSLQGDSSLTYLKIPDGTTSLQNNSLSGLTSLETLYYDAENATLIVSNVFGGTGGIFYDLIVGTSVDTLPVGFNYLATRAETLNFEGPNAFYVEDGAFDYAPSPYAGLSGWIYVTADGIVYTLDETTYEATLYYVPDGITELTIPVEISTTLDSDDNVSFCVTTIAQNAVKDSTELTSVVLEDASAITSVEAYAFANAPIKSVMDLSSGESVTTVIGAESLFTKVTSVGYNAFYNTELDGSSEVIDFLENMDGNTSISVSQMIIEVIKGKTTEWIEKDEDDSTTEGGYSSLTGDAVQFSVSVNNTSGEDQTYRVYVKVTEDDCSLNFTAGTTYTVNGLSIVAKATEDPYTIYLEFSVEAGQTINYSVNTNYPTPTSDGGGVTIWGALVNDDGSETETEDEINAYWGTLRDTYSVAKTNNNQSSVSITADENGIMRPSSELKWQIKLTSDGDQSSYGEDYVTSVTYTDILTLPAGMEWDEDILMVIKEGNITIRSNSLYAGSTQIATLSLSSSTGLSLSGFAITYDEDTGQVILKWKVLNTNSTSANMNTNTLNLTVYPAALTVDMVGYDTDATNVVTNTVTATIRYTYSSADEQESSVNKTITGGKGTVNLSKSGTDVTYFGEDLTYTLKVYNTGGLSYTDPQTYTLTDALENSFYISAGNMEEMFLETAEDGAELVITINNAKLASGSYATDTDGDLEDIKINTGNTDLDETEGNTLTISYNSLTGIYTISVNEEEEGIGTNIEDLLQEIGYGVTATASYTCVWTLPMTDSDGQDAFVIAGGSNYTYHIYATVKTTFQKLDQSDWPNQYPKATSQVLNNSATLVSADKKTKLTAKASSDTVIREAILDKDVYLNGEDLGSSLDASNGDVLDYVLTFTHYGDGSYDDLPIIDDIYGSQYLLVPISQNGSNTAVSACETFDIDNDGIVDYYILTEGSYSNVIVGQDADGNWLIANEVVVTSSTDESFEINGDSYSWSGIHTEIDWYFDDLAGGNYTIEISYKTLVDTDDKASYTIGNVAWVNDRSGSRIYAALWGGGTIISYDKDIIAETGSNDDENGDGLDDDKYTIVTEGETVTYRLMLENTGDTGSFTLTGENIADQLPNTYGVFAWSKENVEITRVEVELSSDDCSVEGADDLMDENYWSISESYNGISGTGIFFIVWDKNVSIKFTGISKVYIYVEVTYPSDEVVVEGDAGEFAWSDYVDEAMGTTLSNTFYVYRNPAVVTHILAEEGEVVLQKGVYGLARSTTDSSVSANATYYATGSDRDNYNNEDSNYRYALYYVVLYNGSSTRLYINDLYDQLPEGFTYVTLFNNYTIGNYYANTHRITTLSSNNSLSNWMIDVDTDIDYMSAGVSASVASDGTLVFSVSSGSGTYAIKYDNDIGQYYLDKDEAIVFGYICKIGTENETEVTATNTIAMAYTDYTGAGATAANRSFCARTFSPYDSNNDGECEIRDNSYVNVNYGFDDGNGNDIWIVSDVSLVKGSIKPGISKKTVSYQSSTTSTAYEYTNSVLATDLVNWKTTLINGGTMSIVDYTVTDIMPTPYLFTGDMIFEIYDSSGLLQRSGTLFTINTDPNDLQNLIELSEDTVPSLSITASSSTTAVNVKTDGTVYEMVATIGNSKASFTLSLYFDDNGNLVMELGMPDAAWAIPEGGTIDLSYTSWNPTTTQTSTTYINQVSLTPAQSFSEVDIQSGNAVSGQSGVVVGVDSLSPATVTSGYATNSYKTITEKINSSNSASSSVSSNSITLSSAESVFTYTMIVENVNTVALTKLVLIDNLPYEGDTYTFNTGISRNSEFTVELASSDIVIGVTESDGASYILTDGYIVEYSEEGSGFTDDDRSGISDWEDLTSYTDLSKVRTIRVLITSEIPAGATVSVSFDAKISGDVEPGSIAWNNFGYRYKVEELNSELEAMPLSVGVKVPSAPELTKKLIDVNGNEYAANQNKNFTFVIYKGEEITNIDGESYTNFQDLMTALNDKCIAYNTVTIEISEGKSVSDTLVMTGDNGLSNGVVWWTWEDGQTYTITEILSDKNYELNEWDYGNSKVSENNSYSFVYDASTTLILSCINTYKLWGFDLLKVDANSMDTISGGYETVLKGAVFALYTNDSTEKMNDDEYENLSVKPDKSLEADESLWYLYDIQTTNNKGKISWAGLASDSYYLVEILSPDGYYPDFDPLLVENSSFGETITATNSRGYELPVSGGKGVLQIYIVGCLLCLFVITKTVKFTHRNS